jgi:poly(3-hydroxybutyrate) depolymerase
LSKKKKSKLTRILAVFLVVLMVVYNMPATAGFAAENPQASYTSGGTPVSGQAVSVNNTNSTTSVQFTAAVNGGHGTISPEQATVNQNGNVEVTLKPDDYYRVSAFTIDGTQFPT